MKYILFLIAIFSTNIAYSQGLNQDIHTAHFIENNISSPLENLSILEQIAESKNTDVLKNIASDEFIKSKNFNVLFEALQDNKINSGSVIEKREKEFFINNAGTKERLKVVFEKRNNWIPIDIKIKNGRDWNNVLPANHPLFNVLLQPNSDYSQFQDFTFYWTAQSGKAFNIIPTNFHNAIIEHVVFWDDSFLSSKKTQQIFTIKMRYVLPTDTTIKNGWLISDVLKENNANYDLNKARNYTPPIKLVDIRKYPRDGIEIKYDDKERGGNVKIKSETPNTNNQVTKIVCTNHVENRYIRVSFDMSPQNIIEILQTDNLEGMTLNLKPVAGYTYKPGNCGDGFVKINSDNNIVINFQKMPNQPSTKFEKTEKSQYIDFKY